MEGSITLNLSFKGSRDYLQGGDIHDALCDELQSRAGARLTGLELVFHRIARTVVVGEVMPAGTPADGEPGVVMRFQACGQNWVARLRDTDQPVTERKPYDEGPVIAAARFDSERQAISAPAIEGYSTIEIVIVLFKELLARVLPEAHGKWLFTRLQLKESLRGLLVERIELVFAGQSGMRLARAKILADGRELGVIFYSLIPKP
jgi:hypothetical protein